MTLIEMLLLQARHKPLAKPIGGANTSLIKEKEKRTLEISEKERVLILQRKNISGLEEERRSLKARIASGFASPCQFQARIFMEDYFADPCASLESVCEEWFSVLSIREEPSSNSSEIETEFLLLLWSIGDPISGLDNSKDLPIIGAWMTWYLWDLKNRDIVVIRGAIRVWVFGEGFRNGGWVSWEIWDGWGLKDWEVWFKFGVWGPERVDLSFVKGIDNGLNWVFVYQAFINI